MNTPNSIYNLRDEGPWEGDVSNPLHAIHGNNDVVLGHTQSNNLGADGDSGSNREEELNGGFLDEELDQTDSAGHIE